MLKPSPVLPRLAAVGMALLLATPGAVRAQANDPDDPANRPPAWDAAAAEDPAPPATAAPEPDPPVSPGNTALSTVTVSHGPVTVTVGVMNPSHTGAPLLLWVEPEGPQTGQLILEEWDGVVLWRRELSTLRPGGELVAVPRTENGGARLFLNRGGTRAGPAELNLTVAQAAQANLPFFVVGGGQSLALADALREAAGGRPVHWLPPAALPTVPAAYLGAAAVILGPDARIPERQGRALRLFHCARGGVVTLGAASLPPHTICQDPPQLVGEGGRLSPRALLDGLKDFQTSMGLLEERAMGHIMASTADAQAASGLLANRPDARGGVGAMVLVLLGLGAALWWTRRAGWKRIALVQAGVPVVGALLVGGLALSAGRAPPAVRLVTVDAREGAPAAFVRTVEATDADIAPPTSDTAWLVQVEHPAKGGAPAARTLETWDVVDVQLLDGAPDPEDGSKVVVTHQAAPPVPAYRCGTPPEETGLSPKDVQDGLGRLLLERCARLRGVVAPLAGVAGWTPDLAKTFGKLPSGVAESRWLYLVPPKGSLL